MNLFDGLLPSDPHGQFAIYLNDHRAGAEGAEALAERCARSNADNAIGDYLTNHFLPELRDDRRHLEAVRTRMDVRDNPFKQWSARLGEIAGRAKSNGSISGYSPLSRLLELETLIAGVAGKRELWRTLQTISATDPLDDRIARADGQIERLAELHRWAADEAFGEVLRDNDGPDRADRADSGMS